MVKIENRYGIPRSTLSEWFKNIELTEKQKRKLLDGKNRGLIKARKKAAVWHREQKEKRLGEAKKQAMDVLSRLDISDKYWLELALSILYWGEGGKSSEDTSIGNSDPKILNFFLVCLREIYNFDIKTIKCELHIRADQNPESMKIYWSKQLRLPIKNFTQVTIDKRTQGSKTFKYYKGVCNLRCGHVAIKRRLLNLSELFCERVMNKLGS